MVYTKTSYIDRPSLCEYVAETTSFLILANNLSSKQNSKNPEHPFVGNSK